MDEQVEKHSFAAVETTDKKKMQYILHMKGKALNRKIALKCKCKHKQTKKKKPKKKRKWKKEKNEKIKKEWKWTQTRFLTLTFWLSCDNGREKCKLWMFRADEFEKIRLIKICKIAHVFNNMFAQRRRMSRWMRRGFVEKRWWNGEMESWKRVKRWAEDECSKGKERKEKERKGDYKMAY